MQRFYDNGAPGERKSHPGYYAAFVLDPDGNNVEAVYHGPVERSAPSVVFTWNDPARTRCQALQTPRSAWHRV